MEPMDGGDSCLSVVSLKRSIRKLSKGMVLLQPFELIVTCDKGSPSGQFGSVAGLQYTLYTVYNYINFFGAFLQGCVVYIMHRTRSNRS